VATHTASVTLDQAQAIIKAARAKADDIEVPMCIAVFDAGNNLTAFSRMDGAWLGSIDIAKSKAYTARAFDMPTRDLAEMAQPGEPLYGIEGANQNLIIFAGGIPLTEDETVVGAVGVSGGTPDQDHEVCEAGVAAYS
jgi:uncharacterized protein GlcG (DUF336 family)